MFCSKQDQLCVIAENFFQQIIWGLSKHFLRSSTKLSQQKMSKLRNHAFRLIFSCIYVIYTHIEHFSDFLWFGTSTSCSAGSQIFFLDKQSETCQKFSWDNQWVSHTQIIKTRNHANWSKFLMFYVRYMHILNVVVDTVFLSKQKVLCGISDIFSRQIIWDLSKVFLRSPMSLSHWNDQNTKIMKIKLDF